MQYSIHNSTQYLRQLRAFLLTDKTLTIIYKSILYQALWCGD